MLLCSYARLIKLNVKPRLNQPTTVLSDDKNSGRGQIRSDLGCHPTSGAAIFQLNSSRLVLWSHVLTAFASCKAAPKDHSQRVVPG